MLKPEDVVDYLKQNPAFFDRHPETLSALGKDDVLPPFHARQLAVLQKRYDVEKAKYDKVVDSARNNQALEQALHEFAQKLLTAKNDNRASIEVIVKQQFDLQHVRICLSADDQIPADIDQSLLNQRVAHGASVCDDRVSTGQLTALFGADQQIGSSAFVPLQVRADSNKSVGVMVLGADEAIRFQPGMGTIYLDRIGQLVAALFCS